MKVDIGKVVNVNNEKLPKFKAVVSIILEDVFVVENIKLIESNNELFAAMPSRKAPSGEYKDICHPITAEFRHEINKVIVDSFKYGKYDSGNAEGLNITEVRVKKIDGSKSGLIGVASIIFNQKFAVHDIKVVQKNENGKEYQFISMPSRLVNDVYRDIAFAINRETYIKISEKVLEEYKKLN